MTTWGYARVSTPAQNLERQIDNIKRQFPEAVIISESFTGTTTERPAWAKLEKALKPGDVVVFDEVSRMSRNAAEGMTLYEKLFDAGINLVFLKEPHINTDVYREQLNQQRPESSSTGNAATDELINRVMDALHNYAISIAREHIQIAFEMAQKEIDLLHQRTSEGMKKAKAAGKIIGRPEGATIETKKAQKAKKIILRHDKDFGGSLSDAECMKLCGISRNTFYKYKRSLRR